jgi:hypothetical protein
MKMNKNFDCVEMKNAIQAKIRKENEGLSDEEIARRRHEWLEKSDDPLAQWWRSLTHAKITEPAGNQQK